MSTEVVLGEEREQALLAYGFPPALIEAIDALPADPILASVVFSDGAALAEVAPKAGVRGALPEGRVVPVCHNEESQLWYTLLVEEGDSWALVDWSSEATEPIEGGVEGYLTDLIVRAWEDEVASDDELVAWAKRMGHPAPERLVEELQSANRSTWHAHREWRTSFLESLR